MKPDTLGDGANELFEDVTPYIFKQFEGVPHREFDSFNQAVDEYFTRIESQKLDLKTKNQEALFNKKIESARLEQESRMRGLEKAQEEFREKASLIEENLALVDQAIVVIQSCLANGMSWKEIEELLVSEKSRQNPVALLIDSLKLKSSMIVLLLRQADFYHIAQIPNFPLCAYLEI